MMTDIVLWLGLRRVFRVMGKVRTCVVISDTHNSHHTIKDLPPADFIFHCGDFSTYGTLREFLSFITWFSGLDQYTHKVFIAGNHDMILDNGATWKTKSSKRKIDYDLKDMCVEVCRRLNVKYLENSSCHLMGLTIYGSPNSPKFGKWGFPMNTYEDEVKTYSHIPKHTDILLTHCPPRFILDIGGRHNENLGSRGLQERVVSVKPQVHCFGHIHESYGMTTFIDTKFINASYCGIPYSVHNEPIYFEVEVK